MMKFLSVYIDPKAKKWSDRIICHDPLFDTEVVGIMALKSLELKGALGFVVGGPSADLQVYIQNIKDADKAYELGKKPEVEIFEKLLKEAMECRLRVCYMQTQEYVESAVVDRVSLQAKVQAMVPYMNRLLPSRLMVRAIKEDYPALQILLGADTYSSDVVGQLAFMSSGDGVHVSFHDSVSNQREIIAWLSHSAQAEDWSQSLMGSLEPPKVTAGTVQDQLIEKVKPLLEQHKWDAVKKGQMILIYDSAGTLLGQYHNSTKQGHVKSPKEIQNLDELFKKFGALKSTGDFPASDADKFKSAGYRVQKRDSADLGVIVKKVY